MLVVIYLNRRVYAAADGDFFGFPVLARDAQGEVLLRLEVFAQAHDVVGFGAVELQGLGGGAFFELQGQDAHADEVGAVDALEAGGHNNFDAEEAGAFGGPIARAACAVFGAGQVLSANAAQKESSQLAARKPFASSGSAKTKCSGNEKNGY